MEIEKLVYEKDDDPTDLFKFCLDNHLYKDDDEQEDFISRMKKTFNREVPYYGVSAVIAYKEEEPVAICMLEHRIKEDCDLFYHQAGVVHFDNRERKNPWRYQYDFQMLHLGFMAFYVKPEFRNNGIAQELLIEMEKLQLNRIQNMDFPESVKKNMGNNFLTVTVREKAKQILKKSTVLSEMHGDITDGCFKHDVSKLSYDIVFDEKIEKRLGDLIPNFCEQFNKKNKVINRL